MTITLGEVIERCDRTVRRWATFSFLLHCVSQLLMWWTAPAPGDESP